MDSSVPKANASSTKGNGSDPDDNSEPKKRLRVPFSCMVCRKRKIRCNKQRPSCDQCTTRGIAGGCYYQDPRWMNITAKEAMARQAAKQHALQQMTSGVSFLPPVTTTTTTTAALPTTGTATLPTTDSTTPTDGIAELLLRIKQVEAALISPELAEHESTIPTGQKKGSLFPPPNADYDPSNVVNLTDNLPFLISFIMRKSRIEYHGMMSPLNIIKSDPFLKVIWLHMWKYLDIALDRRLQVGVQQQGGIPEFNAVPLNEAIMKFLELRTQKVQFKKYCAQLNAPEMDLKKVILDHLPIGRVILSLCTRFFKNIYPLFPLVDEDVLIGEELVRMFGGWLKLNEPSKVMVLTNSQDFAIISILFSIMAITSLTINEEDFNKNPDFKTLKETCTATYSHIAQLCIDHCKTLREAPGNRAIAAMMLLKFYHEFSPEDDSISDRSLDRIQLGHIHATARAHGLHVDPSLLGSCPGKEKTVMLWRKFWHKLMDMDASESVQIGIIPRYIDDSSYDTQVPQYESGMSTEDMFVVGDYKFMAKKTELYRRISTGLFQRKRSPTIGQIMETIEEVQTFTQTELISLQHILSNNTEPYAKVKKITYILELNGLEASLRLRAIGHFHKVGNLHMLYQEYSSFLTLLNRMLNTALNVCYNVDRYVGHAYYFYLRPTLLNTCTHLMIGLATLLARCLQCIKRIPMENHSRLGVFKQLQRTILAAMDRTSQLNNKVNIGYYNSQRSILALSFFTRMVRDPAFDFDKAVNEVLQRPDLDESVDMRSTNGEYVPQTNFLTNLLDVEVDSLRYRLESDLGEVLQPLIGDRIFIDANGPIFPQNGSVALPPYHFGKISQLYPMSKEDLESSGHIIGKGCSMGLIQRKLCTISKGTGATISTPSKVMTPAQLSGLEEVVIPMYNPPELALTDQELSELIGLFDDYSCLNTESQGAPGFEL